MKLRKFNAAGIAAFRGFLDQLSVDPSLEPPRTLLVDPLLTEKVPEAIEVDAVAFPTRFEAGQRLVEWIEGARQGVPECEAGLWTWLSLLLFDAVCPPDANGHRKPGKYNRHVAEVDNWQKRHRHLLLSPFLVYRAHRDLPQRALSLLCQPVHRPGDVVTQVTERQEYWSNKGVVETATELYVHPKTGAQRVGAQNKKKGGARRFADLLNQLDLNWYLYEMSGSELLELLPKEFDRFRAKPQ